MVSFIFGLFLGGEWRGRRIEEEEMKNRNEETADEKKKNPKKNKGLETSPLLHNFISERGAFVERGRDKKRRMSMQALLRTATPCRGGARHHHPPTTTRRRRGGRGRSGGGGVASNAGGWGKTLFQRGDATDEKQFYRARDKHWPGTVLFSKHSEFNGNVRVVQWGDSWRSLDFNGISQGIAFVGPRGEDYGKGSGGGNGNGNDGSSDNVATAASAAAPEVMGSQYLRVMASAAVGYAALNGHDPAAAGARFVFAGLGAGQLPHFLHHHFPRASIEVAEICPVVAEANAVLRGGGGGGGGGGDGDGGGGGLEVVIADAAVFMADSSKAAAAVAGAAAGAAGMSNHDDDDDDDDDETTNAGGGALAVFLDAYDGRETGPLPFIHSPYLSLDSSAFV